MKKHRKLRGKRLLALLLSAVMVLSAEPVVTLAAELPSAEIAEVKPVGSVSPSKPTLGSDNYYCITNAAELYWFAGLVNGTLTDGTPRNVAANGKLMADITVNTGVLDANGDLVSDTSDFEGWMPIGNLDKMYTGVFDGQGHIISGLYHNSNQIGVGLFGANSGTIKNLGVIDSYFKGDMRVGTIAGNNRGTILNCYAENRIHAQTNYVGGVAGRDEYADALVKGCYNLGKVTCSNTGTLHLGGVVGSNGESSKVIDSFSMDSVCAVVVNGYTNNVKNCAMKTTAEFASGEVCWLLNGGETQTDPLVWFQNIDSGTTTDALPTLNSDHGTVYKKVDNSYTNTVPYVPPTQDSDGYYPLGSADDLYWFAAQVNGGQTSINGKLTTDITVNENVLDANSDLNGSVSSFTAWTPIGTFSSKYAGKFDGQNHIISGLVCDSTGINGIGFIGGLQNGEIKNLGIVDSYIKSNASHTGGILGAGGGKSPVTNCFYKGTVIGGTGVGGIMGSNELAQNCYSEGKITGNANVGGIAGQGTVKNCWTTAKVTAATSDGSIGAVIGTAYNCTYERCYYLQGCATDQSGNEKTGIGAYGSDAKDKMEAKTAEQFASGEVAWLLNDSNAYLPSTSVWFQNIDDGMADSLPTLDSTHGTVYKNGSSYTNTPPVAFVPPTQDSDGYYPLGSAYDLYWFVAQVNGGQTAINAKLTDNIVVNESLLSSMLTVDESDGSVIVNIEPEQWTPIGEDTDGKRYTGTVDGQGHTISGLYYNGSANSRHSVGFIGDNKNATIRNLGVIDSYFYSGTGKNNVGGICGKSQGGVIYNSFFDGVAKCGITGAGGIVGAGQSSTKITNCYSKGLIVGSSLVGAICGENTSVDCTNCFYLAGCAINENAVTQNGLGNGGSGSTADRVGKTTSKTAGEFASGEVCWLLNGGETQTDPLVWFQNIDSGTKDASPVLDKTHRKVYKYEEEYSNISPVTLYNILVTDGTASKTAGGAAITEAEVGDVITITADAAPEGKEFDQWIIVSGEITLADESAAATSFTMPEGNVSLKATYKDVQITPPTPPTPTKYEVTVTGGTASKTAGGAAITEAEAGDVITITADATPEGKEFDKWIIVSGEITLADESAATTSFTMPAGNVSLKATYKDVQTTPPTPPAPTKYAVTITDGGIGASGAGSYEENATVAISAGTKEGYVFNGWTSSEVTFADAAAASTTFKMPAKAVTVKANWKEAEKPSEPTPPEDPKEPEIPANPTGPTGTDVTTKPIVDKPDNYSTVQQPTSIAPCEVNKGVRLPDKVYNGKPQTQTIKVTKDGKALKEGTDYKLVYENNINAGKATVRIIGAGDYTGSVSATFDIKGKPLSQLKVITDQVAIGGKAAEPIHVYDGTYELVKGVDYNYTFNSASAVKGTNTVTISAVSGSNYAEGPKPLVAKVTGLELKEGQKIIDSGCITLSCKKPGWEMTEAGLVTTFDGTAKVPDVTVKVGDEALSAGADYTVSVKNNKTAGTAQVVVKGKGKVYTGQATATFLIKPSREVFSTVTVNKNKDLIYTGKLQTPAVVVKVKGVNGKEKALSRNKDYTLLYRCNINAGTAYVTVVGRGNYSGIERTYIFNIKPQNIGKASKKIKSASDVITLKYGGRTLKEGYDYTVTVTDSDTAGKKKLVIEGKGNFEGTFTKDKVKP